MQHGCRAETENECRFRDLRGDVTEKFREQLFVLIQSDGIRLSDLQRDWRQLPQAGVGEGGQHREQLRVWHAR